jgi:hypothetical protein
MIRHAIHADLFHQIGDLGVHALQVQRLGEKLVKVDMRSQILKH